MARQTHHRRRGFTLLEAILSVALTAIIASLIASAISFHLRQLTLRRTQIEEAQLARAVLRRIADDLRATVVYRPADFSTVEALSAEFEAAEGLLSGEETPEEADLESDSQSSTGDDLSTSLVPSANPGLFGNQYELQVDVSRIPRYEEFAMVSQYGDPNQMGSLSDIKTISYFMASGTNPTNAAAGSTTGFGTTGMGMAAGAGMAADSGLARRVVDRGTSRFATENGIFALLDDNVDVFAPEVATIEFAYFDGLQWTFDWDSELRGGIPLAVEITLVIMSREQREGQMSMMDLAASQIDPENIYRLVVHLPNSSAEELAAAEEAAMGMDMEEGL